MIRGDKWRMAFCQSIKFSINIDSFHKLFIVFKEVDFIKRVGQRDKDNVDIIIDEVFQELFI